MQIRRIEIRAFRKLGHLVVDGLAPGLNVLVGDNEAGKSTVLAALRAVLFERHRVGGKVLAAMLPHGADVRPEITLHFTLQGADWQLRKAFNQRPEAELIGPAGLRLTGDAVEDRMAVLLGFQAPGSRGSKPDEHQGVYGLLWVDQGLAHGPLNTGAGQSSLSAALETEVGQVVGGDRGRQLLAIAEERRDAFWDRREKPRGPYRQLQATVADMQAQAIELESRARRHDEQVAALAGKTEILARHTRDDRVSKAARAVEDAREAAERAAQLGATLTDLQRAHARASADRTTAAERLRDRQALGDRVAAAALSMSHAAEQARQAQAVLRGAEEAAREANARRSLRQQDRQAIEARVETLDRVLARQRARADLAGVSRTLDEAGRVAARRLEARAVVAGTAIAAADIAALDRLCAARDQARLRRDAASVQIVIEETAAATIAVDGVPHPTDKPLLLAADAVLELPGFGRLRVRPGGGMEALALALSEADSALQAALRRLDQPSRDVAASALARKTEAAATVADQDRLFAILAPDGLDALRLAVDALQAVAGPAEPDEPEAPANTDGAGLREMLEAARLADRAADAAFKDANAAREAAARHAAILEERAAGAAREHGSSLHALASARAVVGDDRLAGALAEADRAAALAAAAVATAEAALATADPDTAALELRRAEQAERALRADIETVTRDKRDLEVELRTLGQDGIGEQLGEVEGRLTATRKHLASQTLEAQASLLLHRTLAAAQRETKDRWLGPVRERVRPYLKLIQPGSDITLNEKTFEIEHLVRDGIAEPFDSLSVGAREQVAVITRLALADILSAAGQASAIILDDALVNTDETRLDRMHVVLQKAAETLQILVLTCRERDFLALGAPIHRL